MRVLLPRFHNNGKDEETADGTAGEGQVLEEYELETFPVSETTHEATNQEGEGISSSSSSSSSSFHFLDTLDEQNQTTDDSQFEIPLGHRKRIACFTASTGGSSPKKVCVSNKKPPPSQLDTIDSKMTAPRFLEEERDAEEHPTNHNEVLENEPPVPSVASACRNFPVAPEDDPALMPVSRNYDDDNAFVQALKKKGLEIVEQAGDGNCLFRAVSLQVYGDASMHAEVRTRCMDFMAVNEEHFGEFVTGETYTEYIARKRLDGVHGNNPEIQAISELYNRPVEVYTPDRGAAPLNIFHKEYSTADIPIRLAYHDGNHYNAVIDPIRPTAGLGLGLPGLQPGLADKQQMQTAVLESDQQMDLEKAIKESEQELTHAYDDELQRALKESSESMAYVSFGFVERFPLQSRTHSHSLYLDRCTNKRLWLFLTWMPHPWKWSKQR